jgi:ATP-dependent Lon protease
MSSAAPSNQASIAIVTAKLKTKLEQTILPPELKEKTVEAIARLELMGTGSAYTTEYERLSQYLDWIIALPWDKQSEDDLNLSKAETTLNKHHYGMGEVKQRILEFLAVMSLTRNKTDNITRAPILCLVGLVGTGKTTFGLSLAKALNRQFIRIPFGGMGSARDLRGQSRLHPDAEPGQIIKALKRASTKNPVVMLDEIDRVTASARADIMGVLVELLDPGQNNQFIDHYLDYPFDLSKVLFIATANNTRNIATAVLDRLEIIQMPSYTDEEKTTIGKEYVLPKALEAAGLSEDNLTIEDDVWSTIVRPLGYDAGIRTLQRTIEGICRKIARLIVENKGQHFHLTTENIKNYLPNY